MKDVILKGEYKEFANGESGLTKLIDYKGKKYVLRRFKTKKESKECKKIYSKLERFGFLPKLLYSKESNFIFEFIPGRECKKPPENLEIVRQVAEIYALVNKTKYNFSIKNLDKIFYKSVNTILCKKRINKNESLKIKKAYKKFKFQVNPVPSLEVWDVHQGNFILNRKKVYLVDVGGINVNFKGIGIIKSYSWFKTNRQRKAFEEAYNKILPIKFMNESYTNFLIFVYYVNSISERMLKEKEWGEGSKNRLNKVKELTTKILEDTN